MRDTRAQIIPQVRDFAIEVANRPRVDVTEDIARALSTGPDARVVITVEGSKCFSLTAENLSSVEGYGLVYRLTVNEGKERDVESFSGKELSDTPPYRIKVFGVERFVGSMSQHWIDEEQVLLPFLGEIELARNQTLTGPPNPFGAHMMRDAGNVPACGATWRHGALIASLSLGLVKETPGDHGKEINEDGVLYRLLPEEGRDGMSLLGVVADGIGGHIGALAAASSVLRTFAYADFSDGGLARAVEGLPLQMQQLYEEVIKYPEPGIDALVGADMGAPFAAVRIFEDRFQAVRAGDCRIVHYRREGDHYKPIWASRDEGEGRFVFNSARLVGGVGVDLAVDVEEFALKEGDYIVVATDGIWKHLNPQEVADIISDAEDLSDLESGIIGTVSVKECISGRPDNRGLVVYHHTKLKND